VAAAKRGNSTPEVLSSGERAAGGRPGPDGSGREAALGHRLDVEVRPATSAMAAQLTLLLKAPEDGWPWLFRFALLNRKFEKDATSNSAVEVPITVP
jgi:hypothetical protein